ncbi:MAG: tRNA (adenine(22)-N(1))-methyltransferase [Lachnospirales bacterium]
MFFSKRLNKLVDLVKYDRVCDVACDHGFVSILACENKNAKKVIACDINKEPLSKCMENIKIYEIDDKVECRLGDGLKCIEENEVDTAIIGGIGGLLMIKILEDSHAIVSTLNQLILQPQSDIPAFKKYLENLNIEVTEHYIEDNGKYYIIFDCLKSMVKPKYTDIEILIGKNPLKDDEYYKYIKRQIDNNNRVIEKINKGNSKIDTLLKENEIYKGVLHDYT